MLKVILLVYRRLLPDQKQKRVISLLNLAFFYTVQQEIHGVGCCPIIERVE